MEFSIRGEYIELCSLLKAANLVMSGGEGKEVVAQGMVTVDGQLEQSGSNLLLESSDSGHEEPIEIGAHDTDETEPLEERNTRIFGLVQHAEVEVQPPELSVEEEVRHRFVLLLHGKNLELLSLLTT